MLGIYIAGGFSGAHLNPAVCSSHCALVFLLPYSLHLRMLYTELSITALISLSHVKYAESIKLTIIFLAFHRPLHISRISHSAMRSLYSSPDSRQHHRRRHCLWSLP